MDAQETLKEIQTDEQALDFLESVSRDVASVQASVLRQILESNAGTRYFSKCGFKNIPTNVEFEEHFPLISYNDIKQDIQSIANDGIQGILTNEPVLEFLKSSGTSEGLQKVFPKNTGYNSEFLVLNRIARAALNRQCPYDTGKSLHFIHVRESEVTLSGIRLSTGLSSYFTSNAFTNRNLDQGPQYTSPDAVIQCFDSSQACYCHLLCGLSQSKEVTSIGSVFASAFVRSMKYLREHLVQLCLDIRRGSVSSTVVASESVRNAVNEVLLRPDPELADFIERECNENSNWKGIIRRIFPNIRFVQAIITGSMQQYVPYINYLSDNLPIVSSLYASSECSTLGVNIEPICPPYKVRYMIFPCFVYYEFLEVQGEPGKLVKLEDVKVGREYELVITTKAGLYRYRVGDVLKVSGFHNKAPVFSFMGRTGVVLSVDTDKTNEKEIHNAVMKAMEFLQGLDQEVLLMDYTCRVDTKDVPGRYLVYLELSSVANVALLGGCLDNCCEIFEKMLDVVYERNRREGTVGPLEIKIVQLGTFDRVMDLAVSAGHASFAQYKTPKCICDREVVCILEQAVIARGRARMTSLRADSSLL